VSLCIQIEIHQKHASISNLRHFVAVDAAAAAAGINNRAIYKDLLRALRETFYDNCRSSP